MSTTIDIILIAVLAIQVIIGAVKGLSGIVLDFVRMILSFLFAIMFGKAIAGLFAGVTESAFLQNVLGYISTFVVTFLVCTIIIMLIKKIDIPVVNVVDKILGIGIGTVLGILIVSLITVMTSSLLEALTAFTQDTKYIDIYNNSHVLKFIDQVNVFGFIKNFLK